MNRPPLLSVLVLLTAVSLSPSASAWSAAGHQLVCRLAYDRLSDDGRTFVAETLAMGAELDGNGKNDFARACLWPDSARYEDYKGSYEHHFINIPRQAKAINFARDCAAMDCIAVAIQRNLTYLSRPAEGKRERARKAAALRFLGHFIGDLHQPLHVAHGEDWGGNKIAVQWFGEDVNLHRVWDQKILERAGISYPDSIEFLSSVDVKVGSTNVLSWMQDSFKLARSHAYPDVGGRELKTGDELGMAYFERSKPIVIEQIALASIRLAHLVEGLASGDIRTNVLIE